VVDIGISRRGGHYPLDEVQNRFRQNGFVVLRELVPRETRDELRALLELKLQDADTRGNVLRLPIYPMAQYLMGDILAIRELARFDYLFFRRELLDLLKQLLNSPELIYFGDSSIQFGEAARGFHKDNIDRYDGSKDDWKGDYGLIRCALYFQDHMRHSGGLKVRLASHNIPIHTRGRILDIGTCYGDVVLWSMRLTHSGNTRRLRGLPGPPLHPRLEAICPAFMRAPEQMRRISAFCAFGRPGSHTDRYIKNLDVRAADYKAYLQRARRPEEAEALLRDLGVQFRSVADYHGELD
jgi:hypothetical protein